MSVRSLSSFQVEIQGDPDASGRGGDLRPLLVPHIPGVQHIQAGRPRASSGLGGFAGPLSAVARRLQLLHESDPLCLLQQEVQERVQHAGSRTEISDRLHRPGFGNEPWRHVSLLLYEFQHHEEVCGETETRTRANQWSPEAFEFSLDR